MNTAIVIRVDVNSKIGAGHFIRQLALADFLKKNGYDIYFLSTIENAQYETLLHEKNINYIPISKSVSLYTNQDINLTIQTYFKLNASWIILDGYSFNTDYQKGLKNYFLNILSIDDFSNYTFHSDIILNPNTLNTQFYKTQPYTVQLLGPDYLLLRNAFKSKPHINSSYKSKKELSIFISFGASDQDNITEKTLHILNKINKNIHCHILIGNMNSNSESILNTCRKLVIKTTLHHHLNEKELAKLMCKTDLAITSCSSILWECLVLNTAGIGIKTVDNQNLLFNMLKDKNWASVFKKSELTKIRTCIDTFITTKKTHKEIIPFLHTPKLETLLKLLQKKQAILLTEAKEQHCKLLFEWINDPEVRKNSIQSDTIKFDIHVKWFSNQLKKTNDTKIYIASIKDIPIGQIRFEKNKKSVRISFLIAPEFRRKGLGKPLVKQGMLKIMYLWNNIDNFIAEVKEHNISSKKIFTNLNFKKSHYFDKNNINIYTYNI